MRTTAGVTMTNLQFQHRAKREAGGAAGASDEPPPLVMQVERAMLALAPEGARLCVGLSGGVDSVVLLDALLMLASVHRWKVSALHVNHQLSAHAGEWARFCRRLCRARGVPLVVAKVDVARGDSIEAAAREARYAAYRRQRGGYVVLAQHRDDQVETVLLQLLRGAGVKGLAAMPASRADAVQPALHLLRPLLAVTRAEIEAYARSRGLQWVEDESNTDGYYLRNFLRHEILPRIEARVPEYRVTLARAADHFAEAGQLLDALADIDARTAMVDGALRVTALAALPPARASNLLRHFLAGQGVRMPDARRLAEALRQAIHAKGDARVCVDLGTHQLRRHRGVLHVAPAAAAPAARCSASWSGESRVALPGLGVLTMRRRRGEGIALDKLLAHPVTVRLRRGGERLRPDAARPRRPVKDLLQMAGVPPWQRERLPFLWSGDRLVWVAGVGVDQAFQAEQGTAGVTPVWREYPLQGAPR